MPNGGELGGLPGLPERERSPGSDSAQRGVRSAAVTDTAGPVHLRALERELAGVPGVVSVWCGRLGAEAAYSRHEHETHYAASTMKVAVLAALTHSAEAGAVHLDAPVPVHNDFASALPAAPRFGCAQTYDNDDAVWDRLGGTATPRWLAQRMIVRSSNLATNLLLELVGLEPVARIYRRVGARHSVVGRGIEDAAAREAGITNLVTAADLAALLSAIARGATAAGAAEPGSIASPAACRAMLDTLLAQECTEDLAAGLPTGTRIAHKNGWIEGVRHGVGVVFPDDAPPYVLAVCTTTPLATNDADDEACRLLTRLAAASWADRQRLLPA
jgi:beta-lactamase class A